MGNRALAGVRAKIDRGQHHFNAINAALKAVLSAGPKAETVLLDTQHERHHLVFTIPKATPIDPALPLIIGDCIHNLRSALDHLVYQLALRNGASPVDAEKTFFPICLTEVEFDKKVKKLLKPFISDAAFAEIKKSQPYSAYDVPVEADIWVLHKLSIIDKHRLLIVAGQQFAVTEFTVTVPTGEQFHEVISDPQWKPMEDGAEIIRFDLSKAIAAPGEMQVKVNTMTSVQFTNMGPLFDNVGVRDALNQLIGIVKATVRDFGQQFFGE